MDNDFNKNKSVKPIEKQSVQSNNDLWRSKGYKLHATEKLSMLEAIQNAFARYADFKGRARRSEYWNFAFFNVIITSVISFIPILGFANILWGLIILIPSLSVMVRRLHDTGKSGWYALLSLLPGVVTVATFYISALIVSSLSTAIYIVLVSMIVAYIPILILLCKDSDKEENKYGPSPKHTYNPYL